MSDRPLGIYVHWPFCKAKCPYCDFNSHVRKQGIDSDQFAAGLLQELQWFHQQTPDRTITSIFFGGGTPSMMPPKSVASVLNKISQSWSVANDVEITLEANPTSAEAANFAGYASAGVNRVSVGIQALDNKDLQFLGRQHSVDEGLTAYHLACKTFERTSFDLIYARPNQSPRMWEAELKQALKEQQGHMSLYQLTIEPDTAFYRLYEAGNLVVPMEDDAATMYEITQGLTADAGLAAYEVSNHARAGHECRHNMLYWSYGEYAGVGPGAHSRLITQDGLRRAISTEKHPETWLGQVTENGCAAVEDAVVTSQDMTHEYILMGLRTSKGISLDEVTHMCGKQHKPEQLNQLIADGLVELHPDNRLTATTTGRQLLNSVIEDVALKVFA